MRVVCTPFACVQLYRRTSFTKHKIKDEIVKNFKTVTAQH